MTRHLLNFVIDLISALVMLGMVATGLLLRFVLPPGSGSRQALWGLGRHDWGGVHFWMAAGVAVLFLVHVALHWQWVCVTVLGLVGQGARGAARPRRLIRNLAGVALIVVLSVGGMGFVQMARSQVADTAGQGDGPAGRRGEQRGEALSDHTAGERSAAIRGSTTLGEAARELGITVEQLRTRLKLPQTVSADERLGQLRDRYDFTMSQVREAAAEAQP